MYSNSFQVYSQLKQDQIEGDGNKVAETNEATNGGGGPIRPEFEMAAGIVV